MFLSVENYQYEEDMKHGIFGAYDNLKCIFLEKKLCILIKILLDLGSKSVNN